MTFWDWLLVCVLNGACIAYGVLISRGTRSTADWFLAARSLPFWMVGLSLYATAIDASDLVADSGGTYKLGVSYFVTNWVGTTAGWIIAAHWIVLPMFRAGMYTNAEYLEARYGPAARIISALVQVQYRTMVLGIIANTLYLTLAVVCGWGPSAWWVVVAIAGVATLYTAWGGLKSVAVTDALQSVVMVAAAVILFAIVWQEAGGWGGARRRLDAHQAGLARTMLHVGNERVEPQQNGPPQRTAAWVVCLAFVITGLSYSIVNHTQSMRLLGSRSEWDLKMAAVIAGAVMLVMTFLNLTMGVLGRALFPDPSQMPLDEALQMADSIYPLLIRDLLPAGLTGLVVAGVLAASFSTFDSIGSTLSALLTRDVYARLLSGDRSDEHYLRVGRWLTPLIIFGSFGYVPFLDQGMLLFYLNLISVLVVPLLTIYLLGALTGVHRSSGTIGLLAGAAYGVLRLAAPAWLPPLLRDNYAAIPISMAVTAAAMLCVSAAAGWQPPGALAGQDATGWLNRSRAEVHALDTARPSAAPRLPWLPAAAGLAVVAAGAVLSFALFW